MVQKGYEYSTQVCCWCEREGERKKHKLKITGGDARRLLSSSGRIGLGAGMARDTDSYSHGPMQAGFLRDEQRVPVWMDEGLTLDGNPSHLQVNATRSKGGCAGMGMRQLGWAISPFSQDQRHRKQKTLVVCARLPKKVVVKTVRAREHRRVPLMYTSDTDSHGVSAWVLGDGPNKWTWHCLFGLGRGSGRGRRRDGNGVHLSLCEMHCSRTWHQTLTISTKKPKKRPSGDIANSFSSKSTTNGRPLGGPFRFPPRMVKTQQSLAWKLGGMARARLLKTG